MRKILMVALLVGACSDTDMIPDDFHVVMVPGTVAAAIDGGPCDELIAEGSHFYILGGPDSYSFSLSPTPSTALCTWASPALTCNLTSRGETITLTVDGDRARVEAKASGMPPACQMSMDATIEPI